MSGDPGVLYQACAAALRFWQRQLPGSWVPGYLAGRGLDAALLPSSPWAIGYAPASWTALADHLRGLGFHDTDLRTAGLAVTGRNSQLRDFFHDQLMIALRTADGGTAGFIGRRRPGAGDNHGPKYLNTRETPIFAKGDILAGLAEQRTRLAAGARPVLTEGPMDAIAVSLAGGSEYAGLSSCGTALTAGHAAALKTAGAAHREVTVAFDGDQAGQAGAVRAYPVLAGVITGPVTAAPMPAGSDPAEILRDQGPQMLLDLLAARRPLAGLVTDHAIAAAVLEAAARAIAGMPERDAPDQIRRVCVTLSDLYGQDPQRTSAAIIDLIFPRTPPARAGPGQRPPASWTRPVREPARATVRFPARQHR